MVVSGYAPMPALTQETLFGEREETLGTITAANDDLYPFVRVLSSLVDEAKLDATDDGFYVRVVDPANVGLLEVSLEIDHNLPEWTLGADIDALASILGNKKREATVELEFARPYGSVHVSHGEWHIGERVTFFEEDVIRDRPDTDPLELDLPVVVDVELDPLASYIGANPASDGYRFKAEDGELFIGQIAGDEGYSSLATTEVDTDESAESVFSGDYLKTMVPAMRSISGVETTTIHLGDEFPIRMEFETDTINGTFGLAPRITS